MTNYKSFKGNDQKNDFDLMSNKNEKAHELPLLINPPKYFQSIENDLINGDKEVKMRELKKFCSLTMKDNFIYYPSFSSSQIPSILINLLTSKEENDQCYLKIILKIITNLSCKDQYCTSFSNFDIIHIFFDLFLENAPGNMSKNNISDILCYLVSLILNFSTSSLDYRNDAFQYILPITKYAQKKEESQLKTFVFRFILGMTYFSIDEDQLIQIINTICKLLDYVDESTSVILTLTLRKASDYFDCLYNYIAETPILNYLAANLSSTQSNVVYLTLLIFTSFFKNESFPEIPVLPSIINSIDSRSIEVSKTACLTLFYIIENSPTSFSIDDLHKIVQHVIAIFGNRKAAIKLHLIKFLIFLFNKYNELIAEHDLKDFFVSLTNCLLSDDDDFLIQALNLINIIVTYENDGEDDNNKPFYDYLCENDNHELIENLSNHENNDISQYSIQLLRSLRFILE